MTTKEQDRGSSGPKKKSTMKSIVRRVQRLEEHFLPAPETKAAGAMPHNGRRASTVPSFEGAH